jgi:hypothetical protein
MINYVREILSPLSPCEGFPREGRLEYINQERTGCPRMKIVMKPMLLKSQG